MKTMSIALRNLLRNRRRSLATLLAMIIGMNAILLFGGFKANVVFGMQTTNIQRSGHFQIQAKDYFLYGSGDPGAYGIADYRRVVDLVRNDPVLKPMLTVVTPKLSLGGIAGNFAAGVSKTVIAGGVVVEEQNTMLLWDDYRISYARPLALTGSRPDAVVVGTGVARMLQLCGPLKVPNCRVLPAKTSGSGKAAPDDIQALSALETSAAPVLDQTRIEMLAANDHGVPNVAALTVIKAENQGVKEFDDIFMVMHLAQAQRLIFGDSAPKVTAVQVQLKHTAQMPAARARLEQLLPAFKEPLEVQDYETLNPIYGQTVQFFDSVFGFIAVLIGVIVLFTVGNTMSMAVVERTAEIGTLRAIGLRRAGIRRLFMCEGLLLGAIGALLGVLFALLMAFLINHSGIVWSPPGYVIEFPLLVRVWGSTQMLLASSAGMLVVAVLSAWWPANRAAKLAIVDALRHV